MTQTASISSKNKKSFLKKAFKGFSDGNSSSLKNKIDSNLSDPDEFQDDNIENGRLGRIYPKP